MEALKKQTIPENPNSIIFELTPGRYGLRLSKAVSDFLRSAQTDYSFCEVFQLEVRYRFHNHFSLSFDVKKLAIKHSNDAKSQLEQNPSNNDTSIALNLFRLECPLVPECNSNLTPYNAQFFEILHGNKQVCETVASFNEEVTKWKFSKPVVIEVNQRAKDLIRNLVESLRNINNLH